MKATYQWPLLVLFIATVLVTFPIASRPIPPLVPEPLLALGSPKYPSLSTLSFVPEQKNSRQYRHDLFGRSSSIPTLYSTVLHALDSVPNES